jgi:hypothetical protein
MAWDAINTVPAMHGKSLTLRELFAKTANAALDKGQTEEEAIFSGMSAVKIQEKKNQPPKAVAPKVPAHLAAVRSYQSPYDMVSKATNTPTVPTIASTDFDADGRLILIMSDGTRVTTKGKILENIQQYITVAAPEQTLTPNFDSIQLNILANVPDNLRNAGMLTWNHSEDCLDITQEDGSTLQVGLEGYIVVYNNTDNKLHNGTVVSFSNVANHDSPTVIPMVSNGSIPPLSVIGVLTNDIDSGSVGRATTFGKVRGINTTGSDVGETWHVGNILWAHATQAGKLTTLRPSTPNLSIAMGVVVRVGQTDGTILVRPTLFPYLLYGSFRSTVTQTPTSINTPNHVHFADTDISTGVDIIDSAKIYTRGSGLFIFDFRLQVSSSNPSNKNIYIWSRKNGVDIPNSSTRLSFSGNGTNLSPSWSFTQIMAENDYFELMYAVDDTAVAINAPAATNFCPSTPSATMRVTQVNL